jgi:GNAT superfamily N-acetyltransferase
VTIYPNDNTAYLGFFESINNPECAKLLFQAAEDFARSLKCTKIIGPIDASFWLKYRLKTDHFESPPYMGEPYNLPYYLDLFSASGYQIFQKYVSNQYKRRFNLKEAKKYQNRYSQFKHQGYQIVSPKPREFETVLGYVYSMLIELYSDFPVFKPIDEADFKRLFDSYRYILDYSMVKIAYLQGEAVGFFIGLPDYGNTLYGSLGWRQKMRLWLQRHWSRRYVMLYLGVRPQHHGLAKAIIKTVITTAFLRQASYIGALIVDGKVTAEYGKDAIATQYHYALLEKQL